MSSDNIIFSIIVPVYNVEKYLSKCLDSLVNQTYTNIEIICINDGSSDNSLNILEEYATKDNRIKVITQHNQGVSVARNVGIENATGKYILFVDADDWVERNTCEILAKQLENRNYDLVVFNAFMVRDNIIQRGFLKNLSNLMSCDMWSICYNKEFLNHNNIRFPQNIKIAEDHVFKCQALACTNNISIVDNYFYYYLADRGNSASKVKSVIQDDIETFYYMLERDWFKSTDIEKQASIVDFWLKLVGGTLFSPSINTSQINIEVLALYIKKVKQLSSKYNYKLKNLKNLKIFVILIKLHLFWIYKNVIRKIGKRLIILPYRKLLSCTRKVKR